MKTARNTRDAIVRYLYNETSVYDSIAVEDKLDKSPELLRIYEHLEAAQQHLSSIRLKPSSSVTNNILSYSRQSAPKPEEKVFFDWGAECEI